MPRTLPLRGVARTLRYSWTWRSRLPASTIETEILREGQRVEATLLLPRGPRVDVPPWIVLGGVTRMGRHHPQLVRFAHALASSGAAVLVPEIPEWRDLDVNPRVTAPTIRGSLDALRSRPEVRPGKVGVVGLSFGAPQAAIAASTDDLVEEVAGVALFGGYCDLGRTLHCQMTGTHEWGGEEHEVSPDPYGRWVVGANYLTHVPGCEDARDVALALRRLAAAASDLRCAAWEPHHDSLKQELRLAVAPCRRPLFDLFAPATCEPGPEPEAAAALAVRLADAVTSAEPLLNPGDHLHDVRVPVRLIHGRGDRLIPFTESLRFHQALPPTTDASVTVTGLFAHSADNTPPSPADRAREGLVLFGALRDLINLV